MRHAIALFSLLMLAACGGPAEYILTSTARTAGTDGLVTVEDLNGNHMVSVSLEHLPPPERISESATAYLVWIQPDGGTPSLAGALNYDADDRIGRMQATTPEDNFSVIITAEDDAQAAAPSDVVIARQEVALGG